MGVTCRLKYYPGSNQKNILENNNLCRLIIHESSKNGNYRTEDLLLIFIFILETFLFFILIEESCLLLEFNNGVSL